MSDATDSAATDSAAATDSKTADLRLADCNWRTATDDSILCLKTGQAAIEAKLDRNNDMTEALLSLFNGMKGFWNFCTKASTILLWIAKKGTIVAVAITAMYHALEAIASHDIGTYWKAFWNWRR